MPRICTPALTASLRWFARGRARRHLGASPLRGVAALEGLLERRHDLLGRHGGVALSVAGDDVEEALDPARALAVVLVRPTPVEAALVAGRDHVDHVVVHTGRVHVARLLHESPGAVLAHHLACFALARRLSGVPGAVHDVRELPRVGEGEVGDDSKAKSMHHRQKTIYLRDSAEDASVRTGSEGHGGSLRWLGIVARVLVEFALRRLGVVRVTGTVVEPAIGLGAFGAALSLGNICGVQGGLLEAVSYGVRMRGAWKPALQGLFRGVLDGNLIGHKLSPALHRPFRRKGSVAAERKWLHADSVCVNVIALALRF